MIRESILQADAIERKIRERKKEKAGKEEIERLQIEKARALRPCSRPAPEDTVFLARKIDRPHIDDFIEHLFTDFFEQKGDHLYNDDPGIYGGIARFHGLPVTVVGHRKGHSAEENLKYNFGMPNPEGYRKALRLMKQAEKFHRPVICFVDTSGAFCGIGAEERGQGQAIA